MKRKQLVTILVCMFVCLAGLFMLYSFSPLSGEIRRNSFERSFISGWRIEEKAIMDIEYNSFYIAGASHDKIFLGNTTAPFHLLITNKALNDSLHVMLDVQLDSIMEGGRFRVEVDSPYFFITHGTMPVLLRGKIGEWKAKQILQNDPEYFVEATHMGPSSFAFRSYSMSSKEYELAKGSSDSKFVFQTDLLQKQLDGMFCLDGQLNYDKTLHQLVYTHFYRNEIIVADSNLNLIYRSHTLDTFSRAQVKVAHLKGGNENMLSAPPRLINAKSCVDNGYLYVQSNLLSRNEYVDQFISCSVIDVYDLRRNAYSYSFYIPDHANQKPRDVKIFGDHLFAIFDHYLIAYDLERHDPTKQLTSQSSIKY